MPWAEVGRPLGAHSGEDQIAFPAFVTFAGFV